MAEHPRRRALTLLGIALWSISLASGVAAAAPDTTSTRVGPPAPAVPAAAPRPQAASNDVSVEVRGFGAWGEPAELTAFVEDSSLSCAFLDCDRPTGTVSFIVDGIPMATGQLIQFFGSHAIATSFVVGLDVGLHKVAADYSGDAMFIGGIFDIATFEVTKASCSVSLAVDRPASSSGDTAPVVFTAELAGADKTGNVTFVDSGNRVRGVGAIQGGTTASFSIQPWLLGEGTTSLRAVYPGDVHFDACGSGVVAHTVSPPTVATGGVFGPTAASDSATTPVNIPVTIDVLANDRIGTGALQSLTLATTPRHGIATITDTNRIEYTPATGYSGSDFFSYTVTNTRGIPATGQVSVSVTCTASGLADRFAVAHDTSLTVAAPGVLANDAACGSTATLAATTSHGTLVLNPSGGFTYTPEPGSSGVDSFAYRLSGSPTTSYTVLLDVAAAPPASTTSTTTTTATTATTSTTTSVPASTSTAPSTTSPATTVPPVSTTPTSTTPTSTTPTTATPTTTITPTSTTPTTTTPTTSTPTTTTPTTSTTTTATPTTTTPTSTTPTTSTTSPTVPATTAPGVPAPGGSTSTSSSTTSSTSSTTTQPASTTSSSSAPASTSSSAPTGSTVTPVVTVPAAPIVVAVGGPTPSTTTAAPSSTTTTARAAANAALPATGSDTSTILLFALATGAAGAVALRLARPGRPS